MARSRLLFPLLGVLILVGIAYYGSGYFRLSRDRAGLNNQVVTAREALGLVPASPGDLAAKLEAAQKQKAAAAGAIAGSAGPIDLVSAALAGADAHHLSVLPLGSREPEIKTIGGGTYTANYLTVEATGRLADIDAFVEELQKNPGASVGEMEIATAGGSAGSDLSATVKATINFIMLTGKAGS